MSAADFTRLVSSLLNATALASSALVPSLNSGRSAADFTRWVSSFISAPHTPFGCWGFILK